MGWGYLDYLHRIVSLQFVIQLRRMLLKISTLHGFIMNFSYCYTFRVITEENPFSFVCDDFKVL